MQIACWQFWFSDRFTGARNPARLPTSIRSRRIRCAPLQPYFNISPLRIHPELKPVTSNQKVFLPVFAIRYAIWSLGFRTPVCYSVIEKAFHTGNAPMESCRPAIIVSFGVAAHRRGSSPKRKRGGTVRVGAAGIDSVAEFRGCLTEYRSCVHDSKHLARSP
jgi:hypothetical protein